jgi:hypothetical protein
MTIPTGTPDGDVQRELEQRALRNVRTLVDKIETQEDENRRALLRLIKWMLIGFAFGIALLYGWYRMTDRPHQDRTLVIPAPARQAPAEKTP